MPASNKRALEKSFSAIPADAFIYDLEDAVSPDKKNLAREQAVESCERMSTLRLESRNKTFNPLV